MEFGTVFTIWAFIIPAALIAAIFIKEALYKPTAAPKRRGGTGKTSAMSLPTIAVTQTFSVTADAVGTPDLNEEKKYRFG